VTLPLVYVVVLNWNSRDDVIECVGSLINIDYPRYELLVVDNGSSDGSVESLKAEFPALQIIVNETNLGACEGRNVGIRYALEKGADYVALLDNDTVVDQNLLTELVKAGEADPQAGMLVPKVYDYWDRRKIASAGSRSCWFPPGRIKIIGLGKEDSAIYERQREIDYATGCAVLVKREVFERVGMFDPTFFYGWEEYDLSKRIREGGYGILYVPDGRLWHKIASARGYPLLKWRHLGRATVYFYKKHISLPYLALPLYVLWVLAREIIKGNRRAARSYLMGIWDGLSKPLLPMPNRL
jgi:GT2 family glycosyltransferase